MFQMDYAPTTWEKQQAKDSSYKVRNVMRDSDFIGLGFGNSNTNGADHG